MGTSGEFPSQQDTEVGTNRLPDDTTCGIITSMRKAACRFLVPVTDNDGREIDPQILVDLHKELFALFEGFTIHPTSLGRWQSREGRVFQEQVVVYEVAVAEDKILQLRDLVCRFGRRLGQLAMYFDAPAPSVEIIDLTSPSGEEEPRNSGKKAHESRQSRKSTRRGKKNRPEG